MTTRCPDIELELAAFAAGDLDTAAADDVARHLAGCEACCAELDRELALRRTLAALPAVAAPDGLGARPGPRRRALRLPPAAAGGLLAAALLLALLAALPEGPPPPAPQAANPYSAAQVSAARRDAVRTLVLAARILERTERTAVSDVFGTRLPRTVAESLRTVAATSEGGQG